jgi:DNA-directed RNA polymerase specialized sigma24 family protein
MNRDQIVDRKADGPGVFRRIVMRALGLDPAFREVFLLCEVQGFTVEETAHILDSTSTQVAEMLRRARQAMSSSENS